MPCTEKSNPLLFVYGTLMKGFREDWQRKVGAEFVGQGCIRASLFDLGDYPGARFFSAEPGKRVAGELYRLRDSTLALRILDKYEEFFPMEPKKSLFIRKSVSVTLEDGRRRRAWAYMYNRAVDKAKLIPSGHYRDSAAWRQSSLIPGSNTR
jgi:pyruvate carboxylase